MLGSSLLAIVNTNHTRQTSFNRQSRMASIVTETTLLFTSYKNFKAKRNPKADPVSFLPWYRFLSQCFVSVSLPEFTAALEWLHKKCYVTKEV